MRINPVEVATRAANAVSRSKGGWLADIDAEGRGQRAAEFVLSHQDAPAEAVFLEVSKAGVPWTEIAPVKRVAVEVFRATLLIAQRLVDADTPRHATAAADLTRLEPAITREARIGDRIWNED